MIIIVEGPDGAGKTTLVERLDQLLPATKLLKAGPPDPPDIDVFVEYEHPFRDHHDEDTIVCDRWHWGEVVYGPLLRGKSRIGRAEWRHIEMELLTQGACVVVPMNSLKVNTERLVARGDDLIDATMMARIHRDYHRLLAASALPVILVRDPTSSYELSHLIESAHLLSLNRVPVNQIESYTGHSQPNLLLVGDQKNPNSPHFKLGDRGCFAPRPNSSGTYLLRALPNRTWRRTAMINANECDVHSTWSRIGRPPVVALGMAAHAELDLRGVPHGLVPHPQYARRFHYHRMREYGELITEVAGTQAMRMSWPETDEPLDAARSLVAGMKDVGSDEMAEAEEHTWD